MREVDRITGIILAGGKSNRMGKDKALIELSGKRLIERVMSSFLEASIFSRVIIITNDPERYEEFGVETAPDIYPGVGVLGGIHAGLSHTEDEAAFITACDMPLIKPGMIKYVRDSLGDYDAAVPRVRGYMEPLFAVYRKTCLPMIEKAILSGERKILSFFKEISLTEITEDEMRSIDPELTSFFNINSPEDLLGAEGILGVKQTTP